MKTDDKFTVIYSFKTIEGKENEFSTRLAKRKKIQNLKIKTTANSAQAQPEKGMPLCTARYSIV